jgi:hypothetical protein
MTAHKKLNKGVTMSQNPDQAVIQTAKDQPLEKDDIHTLRSGVKVRMRPVSPALVNDAMLRVPMPQVPKVWSEQRGKELPNPLSPDYVESMDRYQREQGQAALNAAIMFGIELVDGLPEDGRWIKQLQMLGFEFDASDVVECEFYFKKHIAMTTQDLQEMQASLGVTPEGIEKAKKA